MNEASRVQQLDLWKVARVDDVNALPADRLAEVLAWVEGLGVPAKRCIPCLVVSQSAVDRKYRVHLSVQVLDESGGVFIDHAAGRVHTEPFVTVVDSWPPWLTEINPQEME